MISPPKVNISIFSNPTVVFIVGLTGILFFGLVGFFIFKKLLDTICLASCGQTRSKIKNQEQQTNIYKVDTSVIAILPFDKILYWVFKDNKPTDLTNDDLLKIETMSPLRKVKIKKR